MANRSKNAVRNIIFGLILKAYQIVIPFFMRTALIYYLGIEYLGLNSLFTSILSVLNLAELGVGSALVYNMYKPISDNDTKKVCELMNLYKKYYRVIGFIIMISGLAISPLLPRFIKSDLPLDVNLFILYFLNLIITVLTYWLFAYRNSILQAKQRSDITSKITIISNTIQYGLQFVVLILFKNYYLYLICNLISQIINNLIIYYVSKKMYPEFNPTGNLEKDEIKRINSRVKDLFTSKVGGVIVNSVDTIVISAFLGLTVLAMYQNYYYILTAVFGFIFMIYSSCTASIGNSLIEESKEKNFKDFKTFSLIIFTISAICVTCLLCLYQRFMNIWVGEQYMLSFKIVIYLCLYFYIFNFNQFLCLYKDAGGIWHSDRYRPLVTSFLNLGLNLLTVNIWGLYGVVLSTVISTALVGAPWLFINVFSTIFERNKIVEYIKCLLKYTTLTIISCSICYFISKEMTFNFINFIIVFFVSVIIPTILFIMANMKTKEFSNIKNIAKSILKRT